MSIDLEKKNLSRLQVFICHFSIHYEKHSKFYCNTTDNQHYFALLYELYISIEMLKSIFSRDIVLIASLLCACTYVYVCVKETERG